MNTTHRKKEKKKNIILGTRILLQGFRPTGPICCMRILGLYSGAPGGLMILHPDKRHMFS